MVNTLWLFVVGFMVFAITVLALSIAGIGKTSDLEFEILALKDKLKTRNKRSASFVKRWTKRIYKEIEEKRLLEIALCEKQEALEKSYKKYDEVINVLRNKEIV